MRFAICLVAIFLIAWPIGEIEAHEVRPAYLRILQTGADSFDLLWRVPARSESILNLQVALPEHCREAGDVRSWLQLAIRIRRWTVECPGGLSGHEIRIDGLVGSLTDVLVRHERLDGTTQVARLTPSEPTLVATAAASGFAVARTYTGLGVEHILLGADHLLFVLALLMIVNGWRALVATVTAFTVAHSITLALAALGLVHVPPAPVEAVIALSILFVAVEIVRWKQGRESITQRRPWLVAFTFGLLHGFGFAGALSEIGLPEQAIPTALLTFNVGVELGQVLFIVVTLATLSVLRRFPLPAWSWRIPVYGIGSMAAFWTFERIASF